MFLFISFLKQHHLKKFIIKLFLIESDLDDELKRSILETANTVHVYQWCHQ